eukprot:scaffold44135_cov21-Tisochrysis_lutea.AAC.2
MGAGQPQLAVLYAMNDRLSKENAVLLAELARFQSGKHPLLRKQGLTTLAAALAGADHPGSSAHLMQMCTEIDHSSLAFCSNLLTSCSGSAD